MNILQVNSSARIQGSHSSALAALTYEIMRLRFPGTEKPATLAVANAR